MLAFTMPNVCSAKMMYNIAQTTTSFNSAAIY